MKGGVIELMTDQSLSNKRAEAGRKGGKVRAKKRAKAKAEK